jgi:hypothetical protein
MGGDAEIAEGSLASLGMTGGELVEGDLDPPAAFMSSG